MTTSKGSASGPLIYAVIPAAGRSRRMGIAKQLLPYDDRTALEVVIETILASPMALRVTKTRPRPRPAAVMRAGRPPQWTVA